MWKAMAVGAVLLAAGMTPFAMADELGTSAPSPERASAPSGPVIQESHIARLRSALNLKPEQQKFWGPVEAALRSLARQQAREASGGGYIARMTDSARSVAGTAMHLRRLHSVAAPLIRVLDDSQKQSAMSFANSSGFGHLAAAF